MYTAFNVKLDLSFFSDIKEYIEIGKNQKNILESTVNKDIKNYVLANEIIDGEKILGNWFKTIKSDVVLDGIDALGDSSVIYRLSARCSEKNVGIVKRKM